MTKLEVLQRVAINARAIGRAIERMIAPARAAIAIGEKITRNKPVIPEMPHDRH